MAEGYDRRRFQYKIHEDFTCSICFGVLREPMQCENNEHYFCCCCIKQHLEKTSLSCPVCNDKLTLETLRKAPKIVSNYVSRLKIRCDNAARGCDVVVELEALQKHLQECDFMPVTCSNEGCNEVMNKRDVKHHEQELCRFKTTTCKDCGEKMPLHEYGAHGCVLRRDVDEMKRDRAEMKSMNTDIVVIAGYTHNLDVLSSVERFNLFNHTWTRMPELKQARTGEAAVLFENKILVCGGTHTGYPCDTTDSIEVLNMNDPTEWKNFSVNLPIKVFDHKCIVYGNRLLIFGGVTRKIEEPLDTIYQLLLVPPYSSKLLCHMKKKRASHGLEMFADDKVLIAGGSEAGTDVELFDITRNECVEMPPLPSPRRQLATVRRDDTMLLIGGRDNDWIHRDEIIEYDFKTGHSNAELARKPRRARCSAVYHGNSLVILGGEEHGVLNAVDCFNFSSNSWKKLPSMIEARFFASAVIVNKDL